MRWWPLRWLLSCNCQLESPVSTSKRTTVTQTEPQSSKKRTTSKLTLFGGRKGNYKQLGFCNRFYLDKTPYKSTAAPNLNSLSSENITSSSSSYEDNFTTSATRDLDRNSSTSDLDMVRKRNSTTDEVCTMGTQHCAPWLWLNNFEILM